MEGRGVVAWLKCFFVRKLDGGVVVVYKIHSPDPCWIAADPNFWENNQLCSIVRGFLYQSTCFVYGCGKVEPYGFVLSNCDFDYVWHHGIGRTRLTRTSRGTFGAMMCGATGQVTVWRFIGRYVFADAEICGVHATLN
jgi:hypothetical protein